VFRSGIWVLGEWNDGTFNQTNGQSIWLNGEWNGGDFENGIWYNGIFNDVNNKSRFGTKSNNTRKSIWKSGKFIGGEFHSFLNLNDSNTPIVSDIHRYSIWETGVFLNGVFYGGIVKNVSFKNSLWSGGILECINVYEIDTNNETIIIEGEYNFNVNDEFWIVDEYDDIFSIYGSINEPKKYKVLVANYNVNTDKTTIITNIKISDFGGPSGLVNSLKLVSNFENSVWESGVWNNGVFTQGDFFGGIFYNGYFEGNFG
jgi:hypothetical protein